ncbi:MAG: DUF4304 domain-containing protein [Myxococcales bacterium]|nr:DUF4304 domain-containing protein [Myxococcales bacterium]
MSTIGKRIDEVAEPMFAALRDLGFRKRGQTARRSRDAVTQIVNLQKSGSNRGQTGRFTINLAIFHSVLSNLVAWYPQGRSPGESEVAVQARLGHLLPDAGDKWWTVGPRSDASRLGAEVTHAVLTYGVPWLDDHTELEACLDRSVTHNAVVRAAMLVALDRKDDAVRLMADDLLATTARAAAWLSLARRAGFEPQFKEVRASTRRP